MKKNTIFGLVITLVFIGGLILMAGGNKEPQENAALISRTVSGKLTQEETFFDFGNIGMRDGIVSHAFSFKNTGGEPMAISNVYTSCMCTSANLFLGGARRGPFGMPGHGFNPGINETLAPGEEAKIEAVFNPNAHGPAGVGRNDRAVYVKTDAGVLEFQFTAYVTP